MSESSSKSSDSEDDKLLVSNEQSKNTYSLLNEINTKNCETEMEPFEVEEQNVEERPGNNLLNSRVPLTDKPQTTKNTDILDSAEVNDLEWTQRCLESGSNPEATCREKMMSVCHIAAYFGNHYILQKILLNAPGLYNRADAAGRTPLHFAAWQGNIDCIAILLRLDPENLKTQVSDILKEMGDTSKIKPETDEPAEKAITQTTISDFLIKYINCSKEETSKISEEYMCNRNHSCDSIREMGRVWDSCTPLHLACARVQLNGVLALLVYGADITLKDKHEKTPLDVCGLAIKKNEMTDEVSQNFDNIIKAIKRFGKKNKIEKNLWLTNQNTTSPLHTAVLFNNIKATKRLLDIGSSPNLLNKDGQTPLHLAISEKASNILKTIANSPYKNQRNHIDLKNKDENTPLEFAIMEKWIDGVIILLEANAFIIDKSANKESVFNLAAEIGDVDIINVMLERISHESKLMIQKTLTQHPLCKAIGKGHTEVVRLLLQAGVTYTNESERHIVLRIAIDSNDSKILQTLLECDDIREILNTEYNNMTALHWAAKNNKDESIKLLLKKGADIMSKTTKDEHTILHIAAINKNVEAVKVILEEDKVLIKTPDSKKELPLSKALQYCRREVIEIFLKHGTNLAQIVQCKRKEYFVIDLIKQNMPRCEEFLENVFNNQITVNDFNLANPDCKIILDYSIILPEQNSNKTEQMSAIKSLFCSGNNFEIKKLILHPYMEIFLYYKWNILKKYFWIILGLYAVFLMLLTDITINMFDESYKSIVSSIFLLSKQIVLSLLIILLLIIEAVSIYSKRLKYFRQLEGWIKLTSLILTFIIIVQDPNKDYEQTRIIMAIALLLSWTEITILLSRFREFGYYYQMFYAVALRFFKVFMYFGCFMIIGYSLIFWTLIRSDPSFASPLDSIVKTLVMMTSEFEYSSIIENVKAGSNKSHQITVQIFFVVFLVLVPILLMNLLLALAVSDIEDLEIEGRIERLIEQIEFMVSLENFLRFFKIGKQTEITKEITIYPAISNAATLPKSLLESIFKNIKERMPNEKEEQMNDILKKIEMLLNRIDSKTNISGTL